MVRILTAIFLAFGIVTAIWFLPVLGFGLLMWAIIAVGAVEYSRMFFEDRFERLASVVSTLVVAAVMIFFNDTVVILPVALSAVLFFIALFFMWRTEQMKDVGSRIGLATLGVLYLGVSFSFWAWLRKLDFGHIAVLFAIAPACLCDTFALVFGKSIGRHKLAPKTSPNKTYEGFFGALIGSVLGVFLVWYFLAPHLEWFLLIGLALIIWITSPLGDLVESMLKRSCGVKDSGMIIPGHGGILDRLDALIFTAPAAYLYMKYIIGW